jgi:NAD(P)-dependent dehydrogenase (short-subunit alcohol dehydrogenase family)
VKGEGQVGGRGRIINTTSGTGLFGTVGQANYGAAKAGIVSLTTITALEMARYGVTANAISPIALTRMTDGTPVMAPDAAGPDAAGPDRAGPDGFGPDGFDPQHPANASGLVVYLASDAPSWLTGQVFRVHGGRVQRMRGWRAAGEYRSKSGGAVEPGRAHRRAAGGVRHRPRRPAARPGRARRLAIGIPS